MIDDPPLRCRRKNVGHSPGPLQQILRSTRDIKAHCRIFAAIFPTIQYLFKINNEILYREVTTLLQNNKVENASTAFSDL